MSTSRAAVRPIMSAPGPRPGSSGRWGNAARVSSTIFTASAMSVPGSDPTPVADAGGQTQSPMNATLSATGDRRGTQDDVAGRIRTVRDNGLAGGDAADRAAQRGVQGAAADRDNRRHSLTMGPQ